MGIVKGGRLGPLSQKLADALKEPKTTEELAMALYGVDDEWTRDCAKQLMYNMRRDHGLRIVKEVRYVLKGR
jgi:hypothetical protein